MSKFLEDKFCLDTIQSDFSACFFAAFKGFAGNILGKSRSMCQVQKTVHVGHILPQFDSKINRRGVQGAAIEKVSQNYLYPNCSCRKVLQRRTLPPKVPTEGPQVRPGAIATRGQRQSHHQSTRGQIERLVERLRFSGSIFQSKKRPGSG